MSSRFVVELDFTSTAALASGGQAQAQYRNARGGDITFVKMDVLIALSAALGGAAIGTPPARWASPVAAENTHYQLGSFDIEFDDGENKQSPSKYNLANILNPSGETFLTVPFVLREGKTLTATIYNRSAASVTAKLTFTGQMG